MKTGFVGLGNVGAKLAGALLRNGCDLTVRDLDTEAARPFLDRGAKWAESPAMMAEARGLVITYLPSPAASAAVMEARTGFSLDSARESFGPRCWARYGARASSDDIIRRLEDAAGADVRAPGFPAEMLDEEPETEGAKVVPPRAG